MRAPIAAVLAAVLAANGLAMLLAGAWWYAAVPGVTATGPFNAHFVKDIGAAYLTCGAALAWSAARPRQAWGAVLAAAAFLILHGLIHVADSLADPAPLADLARDAPGVFLPALICAWLAVPARPGPSDKET